MTPADKEEFQRDLERLVGLGTRSSTVWNEFVEKWEPRLPRRKVMLWNSDLAQVSWVVKPVAPSYWSTFGVPDVEAFKKLLSVLKKARASGRAVRPDPTAPSETTVFQLAYRDATKNLNEGELPKSRALNFLINAGLDASHYNGNTSLLSEMALKGDWLSLEKLYTRGQDFEARVLPGMKSRAAFAGSTMLHRVAPQLMRRAAEMERSGNAESNYHNCLRMLFQWIPDCDAVDAEGLTPLNRIEQLHGSYLENSLYQELKRAAVLRRSQALGMGLGLNPDDPEQQDWVARGLGWWLTGKDQPLSWPIGAAPPEPWAFVEIQEQPSGFPRAYRRAERGESNRVLLRVTAPTQVPIGTVVDAKQAFKAAKEGSADGVLDGDLSDPHALLWVLRPEQVRSYFAFELAPEPKRSNAPRF